MTLAVDRGPAAMPAPRDWLRIRSAPLTPSGVVAGPVARFAAPVDAPVLTYNEAIVALGLLAAGAATVSLAALERAEGKQLGPAFASLRAKVSALFPRKCAVVDLSGAGFALVGRGDILAALHAAAEARLSGAVADDRLMQAGGGAGQ